MFADAEEVIADPVVRNRGTIGGSLCQADAGRGPERGLLGAQGAGRDPRRRAASASSAMDEFHVGPFMTAVGDGEMLTEIRIPLRPGAGSAHEKVERRAGDFAIAAASAAVWIDGGTITDAGHRAERGGSDHGRTSPGPRSCCAARGPSEELFEQAGEIAAQDCSPMADGRGPVDYKRHLAGVLTKRALRRATARALHQEA